jgi:hypothetical protein
MILIARPESQRSMLNVSWSPFLCFLRLFAAIPVFTIVSLARGRDGHGAPTRSTRLSLAQGRPLTSHFLGLTSQIGRVAA